VFDAGRQITGRDRPTWDVEVKSPPQSRHSTRTELANPGATHKWNILTSLNEDLMKTLKS
jgi:hypothetical protein